MLLILLALVVGCAGVTNPSDNLSGHSVTVAWVPATAEVAAYNVYRSESMGGPYLRLETVKAPGHQFVDQSIAAGSTYYYVVTSVDGHGMESTDSNPAIARIPF